MRIAVASDENGMIFGHLGAAPLFRIYDAEDGVIRDRLEAPALGRGHAAIVETLTQIGANVLIAGGFGAPAKAAMDAAGIRWFGGVTGECDKAVEDFLAGSLKYDPNPTCGCGCGH